MMAEVNDGHSLLGGSKTWMPTFVGMTRTTDWFRTLASGVKAYEGGAAACHGVEAVRHRRRSAN